MRKPVPDVVRGMRGGQGKGEINRLMALAFNEGVSARDAGHSCDCPERHQKSHPECLDRRLA